jgi:hypothetical protein
MSRKNQIQFTPTDKLELILKHEAEERGLSVSAVVREGLLEHFREKIEELLIKKNGSGQRVETQRVDA